MIEVNPVEGIRKLLNRDAGAVVRLVTGLTIRSAKLNQVLGMKVPRRDQNRALRIKGIMPSRNLQRVSASSFRTPGSASSEPSANLCTTKPMGPISKV